MRSMALYIVVLLWHGAGMLEASSHLYELDQTSQLLDKGEIDFGAGNPYGISFCTEGFLISFISEEVRLSQIGEYTRKKHTDMISYDFVDITEVKGDPVWGYKIESTKYSPEKIGPLFVGLAGGKKEIPEDAQRIQQQLARKLQDRKYAVFSLALAFDKDEDTKKTFQERVGKCIFTQGDKKYLLVPLLKQNNNDGLSELQKKINGVLEYQLSYLPVNFSFTDSDQGTITQIPLYETLSDDVFTSQLPIIVFKSVQDPPRMCTCKTIGITSIAVLLLSAAIGVPLYFVHKKKKRDKDRESA